MSLNTVETTAITCPYCGEVVEILVDCGIAEQSYIEDCHVCCRPITITVHITADDKLTVSAGREDD